MPVNDWDYLMGDKLSYGHHPEAYTLEDFSELIAEYDKYLAPRLGFGNADKDPLADAPKEPTTDNKDKLIEQLMKHNEQLQATIETLRTLDKLQPKKFFK